jgi:hypothetical protein
LDNVERIAQSNLDLDSAGSFFVVRKLLYGSGVRGDRHLY